MSYEAIRLVFDLYGLRGHEARDVFIKILIFSETALELAKRKGSG